MKVAHRSLWVEVAFLTLLLLLALTCFHVGPAHAAVNLVSIEPPAPTEQDSVIVRLSGSFSDACWNFQYGACATDPGAGKILIDAYIVDIWTPGHACALVMMPYTTLCGLGRLAPGAYTVVATQHGMSPYRPEFEQRIVPFTVSALVPTVPATWSAIKTRYSR